VRRGLRDLVVSARPTVRASPGRFRAGPPARTVGACARAGRAACRLRFSVVGLPCAGACVAALGGASLSSDAGHHSMECATIGVAPRTIISASALFERPQHPYTRLLLDSAPGQGLRAEVVNRGNDRPGGTGCPYAPRCPMADARCRAEPPILRAVGAERRVACHLVGGG